MSEDLYIVETNTGRDSKGNAFGLDGNQAIPVVISGVVSLALVAFTAVGGVSIKSVMFSLLPFLGTLVYTVLFLYKKPPEYRRDYMERWLSGRHFFLDRPNFRSADHPLMKAYRANKDNNA